MGFTMPSGVFYTLDSATVSLYVEDLGAQTAWSFDLFADASGNPNTTPLVNLVLPGLSIGDDSYALLPAMPFTLQPDTTYWLVGSSSSALSYGGWNRNDPSQIPTGLALSAGARSGYPPITVSTFYNSYSIQATPVPGPLPVLGAWSALGTLRMARKRVWRRKANAHRHPLPRPGEAPGDASGDQPTTKTNPSQHQLETSSPKQPG